MARFEVFAGDAASEQRLLLAALQVEDGELVILRRVGPYCEEHASAAWQHRRRVMALMRRVGLGECGGFAAVRRNPPESDVAVVTGDDDGAVVAPGAALRLSQLSRERNDRFARDRHFPQVTAFEESNPAAVRRKERRAAAADTRQQHAVELVECAQHQSAVALVDKVAAVRREGEVANPPGREFHRLRGWECDCEPRRERRRRRFVPRHGPRTQRRDEAGGDRRGDGFPGDSAASRLRTTAGITPAER